MFGTEISPARQATPTGARPRILAKHVVARNPGKVQWRVAPGGVGYHTPFLALAPGGMSASGQTRTSYHDFLSNGRHEGIYDKGHHLRQFRKQTVTSFAIGTGGRLQLTDGCASGFSTGKNRGRLFCVSRRKSQYSLNRKHSVDSD